MRKTIARRPSESKFYSATFLSDPGDQYGQGGTAARTPRRSKPTKISFNDPVIKAVAAGLRFAPSGQFSWLGDKIRINKDDVHRQQCGGR